MQLGLGNMNEDKNWSEEELRELILFTQALREENDDLRSKVIAIDAMLKNRDAILRRAERYTRELEMELEMCRKLSFIGLN